MKTTAPDYRGYRFPASASPGHFKLTIPPRVLRYFHRHGLLERHVTDDMRTWQASGGFSIDASVAIPPWDRAGLERLLRYCARPPFALERLEATGYGAPGGERIIYRLPHPAPDGTTVLSLTPLEFLERLALLIAPPRIHRHRYHGVLAPGVPTEGGSQAEVSGPRARA